MREFEQKKRAKKIIYSKFTIAVLLLILIYILMGAFDVYVKSKENNDKYSVESRQLEELENRKKKLESEIIDLSSPLGQEQEVRAKFSLAKPDEQAVFIIDKSETVVDAEIDAGEGKSIWAKFMSFIGI